MFLPTPYSWVKVWCQKNGSHDGKFFFDTRIYRDDGIWFERESDAIVFVMNNDMNNW